MSKQTRATLKKYFEKGDLPTAGQFWDLIDSIIVIRDDGFNTILYPKGNWASGVSYVYGDAVYLDGSTYYCLADHTSSDQNCPPALPEEQNTWWKVLARKGDQGKKGDVGNPGEPGKKPSHQWVGTVLKFENPDGSYDQGVNLLGPEGQAVELQVTTTHIQWKYSGEDTWNNLIALSDLKGADGVTPVKGVDYFDGDDGYTPQKNIDYFDGADGREVVFQKSATHIQWRFVGEEEWTDLVALDDIKGIPGTGSGDMLSSVYDPNGKNADAFSMDNMVEGTDTKILTAAERTAIGNISNKADLVEGKVPATQLPSYVDDVLEYANLASFPATGESGKIYIALDTNLTYRWSGSVYVSISSSLALGETAGTAYRGDRGKVAYDHSQATGNPHGATLDDIGEGVNNKVYTAAEKSKLAGMSAPVFLGELSWANESGSKNFSVDATYDLILLKYFGESTSTTGQAQVKLTVNQIATGYNYRYTTMSALAGQTNTTFLVLAQATMSQASPLGNGDLYIKRVRNAGQIQGYGIGAGGTSNPSGFLVPAAADLSRIDIDITQLSNFKVKFYGVNY